MLFCSQTCQFSRALEKSNKIEMSRPAVCIFSSCHSSQVSAASTLPLIFPPSVFLPHALLLCFHLIIYSFLSFHISSLCQSILLFSFFAPCPFLDLHACFIILSAFSFPWVCSRCFLSGSSLLIHVDSVCSLFSFH